MLLTYLSKYEWLHYVTLMLLCHCNHEFNSETISKLHIERTPSSMLPWTGCFKGSSSSRASVKFAPIFHSRGSHVPSLTLPPFTCAGVSSQRASSERGTVALGLAPATGPQKSPKKTKTPKFQSPKSARRYKESKKRSWESQGMHGFWWRPAPWAQALPDDEGHPPRRNPKPGIGSQRRMPGQEPFW